MLGMVKTGYGQNWVWSNLVPIEAGGKIGERPISSSGSEMAVDEDVVVIVRCC